jgi:hypothetical protein
MICVCPRILYRSRLRCLRCLQALRLRVVREETYVAGVRLLVVREETCII